MAERLRLADLISGLSIASDLGFGLPPEQAMRSCVLATTLARRLDLPDHEVHEAFYPPCSSTSGARRPPTRPRCCSATSEW